MKQQSRFAVDIDQNCKGQEFIITRLPCFITGNPVAIVEGMGLSTSYLDHGETDDDYIRELLATVDCVPELITKL